MSFVSKPVSSPHRYCQNLWPPPALGWRGPAFQALIGTAKTADHRVRLAAHSMFQALIGTAKTA